MPAPLVLATFNPAQNWVKDTFYVPWQEGKLPESVFYMNALPADNPYVSDEQREIWKRMAPEAYRRFVEGDWSAFAAERPFAYAFNPEVHVKEGLQPEPGPVWLSFDFNVDPITCIAGQHSNSEIKILKEWRLRNSDICALCNAIKADFPGCWFYVTGDATGQNRSALTQGNINYYQVIQKELGIKNHRLAVPTANLGLQNSRVVLNSLLQNLPEFAIDKDRCPFLVQDLLHCEVDGRGGIDKSAHAHRSHLLDCLRYYVANYLPNWQKLVGQQPCMA